MLDKNINMIIMLESSLYTKKPINVFTAIFERYRKHEDIWGVGVPALKSVGVACVFTKTSRQQSPAEEGGGSGYFFNPIFF